MGISQVNIEYIDFDVHLLVANLNLRFYLVVQNQGKLGTLWWQMRETVRSISAVLKKRDKDGLRR